MPRTKISEFSATPADNTDIDGINIGEGMLPSDVNNSIRELMAQLKDFQTGAGGDSFGGPLAPTSPSTIVVNSSSTALRITQTGAGNALVVEDSANPDSTPFVVDSGGRLVIGSTTSLALIASVQPAVQFNTDTGSSLGNIQNINWHNSLAGAGLIFAKSRGSVIGTQTTVSNGDQLGLFRYYGSDGTSFLEGARIEASVEGAPATGSMPGRLVFYTTPSGSSTPTERMRIASNGNVGIGSTSLTETSLRVQNNISGGTVAQSIYSAGTIQSGVTSQARYFRTFGNTAAASFTLSNLYHYSAEQGSFGAGSAVTNQFGYIVASSLIGATNNYGFYSDIASGTGRWNFYANGTAENYLGGNLKVGGTAARGTTAGTNHLSIFNGTAPAGTLTNGITLYSASGDFNFMDSSGNGYQVGYRNIPQNSQSAAYTLVLADAGKHILHPSADTTARTFTIPANSSVAFPVGTAVTFVNQNGAGAITIAITDDTMRLAGAGTTGSRTLAANGVATAIKITSTEWIISGTGLT